MQSLNSVIENGKDDAQLTEDLLDELNNTRRSVRQQAIKLMKESDEPEPTETKENHTDNSKSLPLEDSSKGLQADASLDPPPPKESINSEKSMPTVQVDTSVDTSEKAELDSPATPQKRGRGRPRKNKTSTPGGRSADSSAEGSQRDSSAEMSDKRTATDSESDMEGSKPQDDTVAVTETAAAVGKETNSTEVTKALPLRGSRKIPERSVRMSPLKNIPAAQRRAVNAKVATAGPTKKLELGDSKDTNDKVTEKDDNLAGGSSGDSRRKRRRDECETDDGGEEKDENEKRETRSQQKDEELNQDSSADSGKEEPKRKRGRPRKNPVAEAPAATTEKEQVEEDPKTSASAEKTVPQVAAGAGNNKTTKLDLGTDSETGDAPSDSLTKDKEEERMDTNHVPDSDAKSVKNVGKDAISREGDSQLMDKSELSSSNTDAKADAPSVCTAETMTATPQSTPKEPSEDVVKESVPSSTSVENVDGATNSDPKESTKTVETPDVVEPKINPDVNVPSEPTPTPQKYLSNNAPAAESSKVADVAEKESPVFNMDVDTDHSESMITEVSIPAPIPISGADAAANALPSNSPSSADFPVGTAGSVTPQKAAAQDAKKKVRPRPRSTGGRTHFGMKKARRSVKRNNYDSGESNLTNLLNLLYYNPVCKLRKKTWQSRGFPCH